MQTCSNCVHVEVCRSYITDLAAAKAKIGLDIQKFESKMDADDCKLFKDRSKFVELPCNLGDKVYYFDSAGNIYSQTIFQIIYGGTGIKLDSDVMFDSELIGKRFFLTKEEAEQALKEQNENRSD